MTKLFNSRPIFFGAISLIISIITVSCYLFYNNVISLVFLILLGVMFLTLTIFLVIKLIYKNYKSAIALAFAVVFTIIGVVGSAVVIIPENKLLNGESLVTGYVSSVTSYTNVSYIELSDVTINGDEFENKIQLNCFSVGNINVKIGDMVSANVKLVAINKNYENLYYITEDISYTANCNISAITITNGEFNFKASVINTIKENLDKFLNKTNSAIAFSAIFGSKDGVPTETYNMFSFAGIAHILAVSGLHIGFLVSVLSFILKLFKCNKNVKNIILIIILITYAYLCNFTASVTRAVIMSIVLLISKSYAKEYDALNSLSLSAIIILLFSPMSIFLKGFQLSFLSVFSIITLANPIKQVLAKIKCPEKLSETIALSLAVNFGILCISAQHFNQINLISIFSNLIVIPVFSICFSVLFVISFLGLILPFLNYLLVIPNVLLHFIKLLANLFANINILNFELFKFSYVFVALSILTAYIFHFALAPKNIKRIVCSLIILTIVFGAVVINIPTNINSNLALTSKTMQGNYVLLGDSNNNTCLVVNGVTNANTIINTLNQKNINKINSVVVNNYSVNQNQMLNEMIEKYNVKNLYVANFYFNMAKEGFGNVTKVNSVTNEFSVNNINIEMLGGYIQDNFGIKITFGNNTILLINNNANAVELNNYFLLENNFDYIISSNYSKSLDDYNLNVNKVVDDNLIQILQGKNLFELS